MGIFSNSTPFDAEVEKITDEKNTSEDWGKIIDLCDRIKATANGPKDCLKSILKRLNHPVPHVVLQAITLLDACVNNCDKPFKLEIASREFEGEFKKLLAKSHHKIQEKLRAMLKKWSEVDFKGDPQLALIPSLYTSLKKEGIDFDSTSDPSLKSYDSDVKSNQKEEDDIARAIQMSLEEPKVSLSARPSSVSSGGQQLYPSTNVGSFDSSAPVVEQKKGRALYDFEAAEDNELTFKAGEIVIIIDDGDANWWKGSNHRGEGLFPANFVSTDLETEPEQFVEERQQQKRRRSVQFNEEVEVKTVQSDENRYAVEISEDKIDGVMSMLNEADPTSPENDPPDLVAEEDRVNSMGPLIDAELERIDRRHAQLTRISTELVDALNLYHQLMHDVPMQQPSMMANYMQPPMNGAMMPPYPSYGSMPYVATPAPYGYPEMASSGPSSYTPYAAQPPMNGAPVPPMNGSFQQDPQQQQPVMMDPSQGAHIVNDQMYFAGSAPPPPASSASDVSPTQQPFGSTPQMGTPAANGGPSVAAPLPAFQHSQVPPMNQN